VLEVIGRTEFELEPVFETVLRQAVRLCAADAGLIYVLADPDYELHRARESSAASARCPAPLAAIHRAV
jgi:hypothetical protein